MQSELEIALHDLLLIGDSSETVAHEVSEKLLRDSLRFNERQSLIQFLIQSGHYKFAFKVFRKWFTDKKRIPWQDFLNLVYRSKATPIDQDFLSHFFQAMDEVGFIDKLTVVKHWESYDSKFKTIGEKITERVYQKSILKEKEMFEKLDYFEAHRMLQQEEELLQKLIIAYPENADLSLRLKKLKTRWAHSYVADKSRQMVSKKFEYKEAKDEEAEQFADHLKSVMVSAVNRYPNAAYDFSIGLNMIEFHQQALDLLQYTLPGISVDWFRVELLLKCRRYLECLDEIGRLEKTYADDPESTFAATYLRAQTLKGLGQKRMALKLLRSIVHVRPNYRSAHDLIVKWDRE